MKMNSRFAKVAVASGLVVATGAAVLGITGFASAQVARQSSAVVTVADNAQGEGTTDASNLGTLEAEGSVSAESAESTTGVVKSRPQILAAAAKALGITEAELVTELQANKSIKQVADAKNVDIATVTDAMVSAMKAHLDEEVASGEHTQAEADAKLTEFKTRLTEMVNKTGLPHKGKGGHGMGRAPFATANLAKVLNLSETELQTELQSGKTIKQIADEKNVDIADVKAVLTADFKAHLDEEVASGEHTQAEADAKLTEFTARLDDMVNGVRPVGGKGGHGGRHGHGRGHGPMGDAPAAQSGTSSAQGTSANI
jgi:lipoate-protein ligase A